jgi:hypothetical protein
MTDALRPGRVIPTPRAAAPRTAAPRTAAPQVARPTRIAVITRTTSGARHPYHVGVLLGLSAGAYAVALAGVATLQSATEQTAQAANAPAIAAIEKLHTANETLDRQLAMVRLGLSQTGAGYDGTTKGLGEVGAQLDALASSVGVIEGQAAALPTRISLPSAPRISAGTRPATVATTGASGKPVP